MSQPASSAQTPPTERTRFGTSRCLSWSELFRAQHRVHQVKQQNRAHPQRNDCIEHFPYLNPSQNCTYNIDNPKKTIVEMKKMFLASPSFFHNLRAS